MASITSEGIPPKPEETIQVGKDWLLAQLHKGANCPLCGQRAQLYRRKINAGMAHSMIRMYRSVGTGWCHVPTVVGAKSREEGKCAYWGLLEEQSGKGLHGGRAGYWRLTERGEAFVLNQIQVPTYALVYNGRVMGFEGAMMSIKDALGTKFDYRELMDGV